MNHLEVKVQNLLLTLFLLSAFSWIITFAVEPRLCPTKCWAWSGNQTVCYSPVENKNDLELDFKVFFFTDSCCSDIVHDESNWCHSGIIERFEKLKMASKMAVSYAPNTPCQNEVGFIGTVLELSGTHFNGTFWDNHLIPINPNLGIIWY